MGIGLWMMTATKWNDAKDSVVGAVQSWNKLVMGKAWLGMTL